MHELTVLYASSFLGTDPCQPQRERCWTFEFFFGQVVELPTLDNDPTLFVLLQERSIDKWVQKGGWIIANHGLINVNVRPDYLEPQRLSLCDRRGLVGHEEFLGFLFKQGVTGARFRGRSPSGGRKDSAVGADCRRRCGC
jgi:hypothetical protein